MNPYTIESLQHFNNNKLLYTSDVKKVNRLVTAAAAMRAGHLLPKDGDKILCLSEGQEISDQGYLECRNERLTVCIQPSEIYMDVDSGRVWTQAVGTSWIGSMDEAQFLQQATYAGKALCHVWTWGKWAPRRRRIDFEVEISLWQFTL